MANLKNITELPVAESAEGLNLIVNDNGAAKQIAASAVGAQADFNVTDESHPAFIKNKPVRVQADWAETDETSAAFIKNKPDYDAVITLRQDGDSALCDLTSGNYSSLLSQITNGEVPNVLITGQWSYGEVYDVRGHSISCYYNTVDNTIVIHTSILWYNVRFTLVSDGTLTSDW